LDISASMENVMAKTGSRPAADRLAPYRAKRDFAKTGEPSGPAPRKGSSAKRGRSQDNESARFVVQRHRASRLHYDFRLEIGGVLVSWAVPKGPSLDPKVRRAAFHVEDHPLDYYNFEGVIPAGQYGGGDVIVWDAGTWAPHETNDAAAAVAAGELHLDVQGEKLRGRFVLVRTRTDSSGKEEWLMLHKQDDYAVKGWNTEDHPRSVLSGRTNDEVKADPDRLWRSDLPAARAAVPLRPERVKAAGDDELAELDALKADGSWSVFGRDLRVTNLDKVLFPARRAEKPVTKRDLLRYAAQVAPIVVPYLRRRAFNMHRYPGGATSKGFWHKALPTDAPEWLPRWDNPDADPGETTTYLVVDEPAALIWAANFGALDWHAWTSLVDHPDQPTYALIDLDPGEHTSWPDLLVLARLHRTALDHLGVRACPKITGGRGIQIWIPIAPGPSFDDTRAWVEGLSKSVAEVVPELVSWKWQVADRGGLARLDYTQNAVNKTLVAPYSPRPAAGAPVSAPISWDELDDPTLRPDRYTVRSIMRRIADKGDLFSDALVQDQTLPNLASATEQPDLDRAERATKRGESPRRGRQPARRSAARRSGR
jgi:bifunctional non-homologous end joining protein LigD